MYHIRKVVSRHKNAHCSLDTNATHDDVIKWKHFPRNWPFVRGIHRSPVNSPHKGQWRGALMFSLICVWINDWVNNREAGNLRRYRAHYDVTVMPCLEIRCSETRGLDFVSNEGLHMVFDDDNIPRSHRNFPNNWLEMKGFHCPEPALPGHVKCDILFVKYWFLSGVIHCQYVISLFNRCNGLGCMCFHCALCKCHKQQCFNTGFIQIYEQYTHMLIDVQGLQRKERPYNIYRIVEFEWVHANTEEIFQLGTPGSKL